MSKYHGTPMGGTRADRALAITDRLVLIPYPRPDDLDLAQRLSRGYIADNGAYSDWRAGHPTFRDYPGYLAWVEKLQQCRKFHWAVIPDQIGGSEAENNALLAQWPANLRGVPVYHMHHSLDRLRYLAQTYPTVALGGGRGYEQLKSQAWWARIGQMMEAITDDHGHPICRLHGLRMLDPKVFTVLPLESGDSANVARNSSHVHRFPEWLSRGERACVLADRIERYPAAAAWKRRPVAPVQYSLFGDWKQGCLEKKEVPFDERNLF